MTHVTIIAEAGVNYNGSLETAYRMVDKAIEAGADIIKFQTGIPEKVMSAFAPKAAYQKETTGDGESQLEMVRKLMLKFEDFYPLKDYCTHNKIKFLSTPFDLDSIDFLDNLGCDIWKIPSGEITNLPYLERICETRKPVILSTGMSTLKEVREAIQILNNGGIPKISLLHCTTEYPAPYSDVNLLAMLSMKDAFGLDVGYSDHTLGIEIPIAAVAMGATIIEKHFTLDRNMDGPDHKASLEPDELAAMVEAIRNVELAMGNGIKEPASSEIKNIVIARKSIIASRNIKKGEILTEENLTTKRPGTGISPMKWYDVIGTKAVRDFMEDEMIEL